MLARWIVEIPIPPPVSAIPLVRPPRAAYLRRGGAHREAAREEARARLGARLMREGQSGVGSATGSAVRNSESRQYRNPTGTTSEGITPPESESRQLEVARLPDEWAGRLRSIRATLDKARRWQAWIDADEGRRACDLAVREGVTRARVSQVLALLKLAPEVQADIDRPGRTGKLPSERELRELGRQKRGDQVRAYREATGQPLAGAEDRRRGARSKGFQHLFARARRYRELLTSGEALSMADIARVEGITATRVADLLYLTNLAPEIEMELDRPVELAPYITDRDLRKIARVRDPREQVRQFRSVVEGVAAK